MIRNVAALAVMPRTKPPTTRRSFTSDEAKAVLRAAQGERLEAMVALGLATGLRPGELTGLLWSDLDLDLVPLTLRVSGAMKRGPDGRVSRGAVKRSKDGLRTLSLPPSVANALRAHRRRQIEERLAAGPLWRDSELVFASGVGTPLDPSDVRRTFARIGKRAGIPDANYPYLLRHSAVSLLLDGGASIEEVADLLGDDPRTLYRHYRHKVRPVSKAADRMEGLLSSVVPPSFAHVARARRASKRPLRPAARAQTPCSEPVGVEGVEPTTSCASCMRSNQLSYTPETAYVISPPAPDAPSSRPASVRQYGNRAWRQPCSGVAGTGLYLHPLL